ncbi:MAG: hypothetical protein D6814_10900, partial [Calditrichaeota bacterium]
MNYLVIFPIIGVMIALRYTRINALGWMVVWWVAIYLTLRYGINPPLPSSIIGMFMGIVTFVLLAYLTASSESLEAARRSIVTFMVDQKYFIPLVILVVALPVLVAGKAYLDATRPVQA